MWEAELNTTPLQVRIGGHKLGEDLAKDRFQSAAWRARHGKAPGGFYRPVVEAVKAAPYAARPGPQVVDVLERVTRSENKGGEPVRVAIIGGMGPLPGAECLVQLYETMSTDARTARFMANVHIFLFSDPDCQVRAVGSPLEG